MYYTYHNSEYVKLTSAKIFDSTKGMPLIISGSPYINIAGDSRIPGFCNNA